MKRQVVMCLAALTLGGGAWAQNEGQQQKQQPATGGAGHAVDLSRMGPWTRKPTNEAQTRKEIQAFFREEEALMKKKDLNASLARIDFPVFMATDDSKGIPEAQTWDRQKYSEMMRPMYEQMPADLQLTHKPSITVLSDSLASIVDDFTMTTGGEKRTGRKLALLVKRDGQWRWKAMVEPGWGHEDTGTGGSGMPKDKNPKENE
jgi:hypothetical protein